MTAEQVVAAAIAVSYGLSRYAFTSSIAPHPLGCQYDEGAPLVPLDFPNPYAAQKAASERALFELHRQRGIPVTTLRPTFVDGPHNPFRPGSLLLGSHACGCLIIISDHGSRPTQWGTCGMWRTLRPLPRYTDVAVGHADNLASYPAITQFEFVQSLANVAGRHADLVHVPREHIQ